MNPLRPRRIRIVEPGFESLTGWFGTVEFTEGVSNDVVPWQEQQRLGGLVRFVSAEEAEEGMEIGPAAELVRIRDVPADDPRALSADSGTLGPDGTMRLAGEFYTREQLEGIADSQGLKGLRDIAKAWEVKGRAINDLIVNILKAQTGAGHQAESEDSLPAVEAEVEAEVEVAASAPAADTISSVEG